MSEGNIGAGLVTLTRKLGAESIQEIGAIYDPLPEIDHSRESLDDSNTESDTEQSKAGMKKHAPMAFKVKTDAAGIAAIKSDYETGTEAEWVYKIPNGESSHEEVSLFAWVSSYKVSPALKNETFVTFTLNVNKVQ